MTLGERIAALRSKHHMSQGDLAERLNVSRQSISKWETGSSVPDLDKLIALSDLFQISLDELIRGPLLNNEDRYTSPSKERSDVPHSGINKTEKHRTVGLIFIAISLFLMLFAVLLGGDSNTAVLFFITAFLFLLSGIICLLSKGNPTIPILWVFGVPLTFVASAAGAGVLVFLPLVILTLGIYYRSN